MEPDASFGNLNTNKCGYCLSIDMTDPRVLPCCQQPCCFTCLQEDLNMNVTLQCPYCRTPSERIDIGNFLSFAMADMNLSDSTEVTEYRRPDTCDLCNNVGAAWYCSRCEVRICEGHTKVDEDEERKVCEKGHEILALQEYLKAPWKYEIKICPSHGENELTKVCTTCNALLCPDCSSAGCTYDTRHVAERISNVALAYKNDLTTLINQLYDKCSSLHQLEKNANKSLSEMKDDVQMVKKKPGFYCEEQKLVKFERECDTQFTEFIDEIQKERNEMEATTLEAHFLARRSSDLDVVLKFKNLKPRIKLFLDKVYTDCRLKKLHLTRANQLRVYPPSELKFVSSEVPFPYCRSVTWTRKRRLLVGTRSGIHIRDESLNLVKSMQNGNYDDVKEYEGMIIALNFTGRHYEIELYSEDLECVETLVVSDLPTGYMYFAKVSLSGTYLAFVKRSSKQLKVLSLQGKPIMELDLSPYVTEPQGLLLLKDYTVLITDIGAGKILKFRLVEGSEPLWICDGLESPVSLHTDSEGFIYVASKSGHKIYCLTPGGKLLGEITNDDIKTIGWVLDVAVFENKLAISCDSQGVRLYELVHNNL